MKAWLKTSIGTVILLGILLYGIFQVTGLKIVKTSSGITFSPPSSLSSVHKDYGQKPKNIIVFIADGLGFSHLSLAMLAHQSEGVKPVWDRFEIRGWHDPRSTYGPTTDSGASATAMATGTSTFFDVIGMDEDGNLLTNVFEIATSNGYNTGIVTDSYVWDATPAAFVAHTMSRDSARTILEQMSNSELDILFGELEDLGEEDIPDYEETMEIIQRRYQILDANLDLPKSSEALIPVAAIYQEDEVQDLDSNPNLTRLTEVAMNYLTGKNDPFIILVESEEMDAASHANDSDRVMRGIPSIQETVSLLLDFAEKDEQTLVLFTSDHETGGLAAGINWDTYPDMQMIWSSQDHTATVVPLLAYGPGAHLFRDVKRNSDIGIILKELVRLNDQPD